MIDPGPERTSTKVPRGLFLLYECMGTLPPSSRGNITTAKLFSSDYLQSRLPQRPDWRKMAPDREKLEQVAAIYRRAGHLLESANEMQIRDEGINPILFLLDHQFLADQFLPKGRNTDYSFY